MRILLTGGTGFIGRNLRKKLIEGDHKLLILTRAEKEGNEHMRFVYWNWQNPSDLIGLVEQSDVVINLAGEPVANGRWTTKQKHLLYKSRIITTQLLVEAINTAQTKPKKLISASAIGIYGDRKDEILSEASVPGSGFLRDLCKDWESEAKKANTNVTIVRIGIVLGKYGGILERVVPLFKSFLGGQIGSGNQYMSWISMEDTCEFIKYAAENDNVTGTVNLTSPNPVTNIEFTQTLGRRLHRVALLPVPALALRILYGEMADLLLHSQRVIPQKALEFGYIFKYTDLESALKKVLYSRR